MKKLERLGHLAAWRMSGLSPSNYCEKHGLKYNTFMSWFRQASKEALDPIAEREKANAGKFIAIEMGASDEGVKWEIIFPNGIRIEYGGELTKELIQSVQNA